MANRLINESSPYLQQHAHNPVDWYPWGPEAFDEARRRDRPVFVSIGYATCHWCHVMERESFEDEQVSALMNAAFVNVKVDREERPDIDGIYMTACQMLTGQGGWPLNVLMTPDQKPLFIGTYIPKSTRQGRIGMMELVPRIQKLWGSERDRMLASAEEITALLRKEAETGERGDVPPIEAISDAAKMLRQQYDRVHHGFGQAPKFPMPHNIGLLLLHHRLTGDTTSAEIAEQTLLAMARGGIHDHIGFGFHRYATDQEWLVPHFEKMLYDQALLMRAYVEGYQATGNPLLAETAQRIATYVLRDLTAPNGGFYSAEDADSEGVEGKFYVWSLGEVNHVLAAPDAALASRVYRISEAGNYRDEVTGRQTGANIPHLANPLSGSDNDPGSPTEQLAGRLERIRASLFSVREGRVRPLRDEKILADWNGLMIGSLAMAGSVLGEPSLIDAAGRAASFVLDTMMTPDGRLLHRSKDGKAGIAANLDDYSFMANGCFTLFQVTQEARWLKAATIFATATLDLFWDTARDGFFFTPVDGEVLIVRRKETQDGAVPSGAAVLIETLIRLARVLARPDLEERARLALAAQAQSISRYPTAHTMWLMALGMLHEDSREVVVVGARNDPRTEALLEAARSWETPGSVVVLVPTGENNSELLDLAPFLSDYSEVGDAPTAYVCSGFVCQQPTNDPLDVQITL